MLEQHLLLADVCAAGVVAGAGAAVRGAARLEAVTGHTGLVASHPSSPSLPLPQPGVNLSEVRPPGWNLVPALHHEGVHPAGAVLGARQQLAGSDHLYHLAVAVAVVRLQTEAVDLPEHHPEGPDVRLGGELAVENALRWHPPHRQQGLALYSIVVRTVDVPGETKVRYLHCETFSHQSIPGGQVAVYVVMRGEVLHT